MCNPDPVARAEVTGELMAEAAESDMTVMLSTHIVAEPAGASDYLLLLAAGPHRTGRRRGGPCRGPIDLDSGVVPRPGEPEGGRSGGVRGAVADTRRERRRGGHPA